MEAMDNIKNRLEEQSKQIASIQQSVYRLDTKASSESFCNFNILSVIVLIFGVLINVVVLWVLSKKS